MSSPERVDVVVVGAGIAGSSAADAIARRGRSTVLLETEPQPGHHATGRSAAILSETSGSHAVCALAAASRAFLETPPDGFTDHDLTSARGLLWVGTDDDRASLDALAEAGQKVAPTVRRIDPDEARRLVPALRDEAVGSGGVFEPDARTLDVAGLLDGFLRSARRHGAAVHPVHEALWFDRQGEQWLVHTTDRTFLADHVVNAAGAWGDVVAVRAGVAPVNLRPLRRTACLVPVKRDDIGGWPMVMDVANRYYFEPEAGGILVSLADETPSEACDAQAEELDVALALERLDEATTLAPRSVRRAWAGLRTFAPDRIPVVGPDPDEPTFVWCVGQGGAGIKTAPAVAEIVAASVSGAPFPVSVLERGLTVTDLSARRLR